ncbi:HAD-IIIC family phosphatase, partial [Undibacterium sp. TJN19]|uniref:HAD-IIIC family phosphatase n=1 Tax=Undibacterium sp. TJN19 TaxID=3413055 RepID=UPI003BF13414
MAQELDDVRLNAKEADVFVVAGFTAEPLQNFLAEQLSGYGIASTINFAPFGQVFQSLLNQDAGLRTDVAGINLLLLRVEDFFCLADRQALQDRRFNDANWKTVEQLQDSLVATLTELDVAYPGKFVVALCPSLLELAAQDGHDNRYLLALESRLLEKLASLSVAPIVPADFYVGHSSEVFDLVRDEIAKIPFRDSYFSLLAQVIATRIANFHGFEHKLIVLDADGTLWQGICGEQEPDTLVITRDQLYLQNLVRKAKQQGMLLALVSKNNPADVERVFEENADMVLQRDDFIAMRVNWQSKAQNIAEIAAELNLSSSSFIFIDDNAVELVEVGAAHPGLLLLPIPQTSDDAVRNSLRSLTAVLERSWLFQRLAVTEEDTRRTQLYQLEQQRKHLQSSFGDLASFIQNLGIEVRFYPLDAGNMNRAAQLSAKTNQFNLRKIPRSQDELQSIIEKKNTRGFIVQVQDKFGDYGQTGVVVLVADSAANSVSTLIVDTFLLSCRVLGRHIEYCVLQKIREHAESLQCAQVHFPLVRSDKNAPVQLFLDKYFAQYADAGNAKRAGDTVLDYLIPVDALAKLEVPQSILIRDEISGLADAQATVQSGSNAASPAELNSISALLCRLVRKNLALEDKVLASDNYFSLGGNSLKAVNLIVDSRKEGLSYTLDDVIGSATIADIASLIRRDHAQFASVTPIAPFALLDDAEKHAVDDKYDLLELDDAFPLSSLQQGMIYHSLKEKDLHLYQNVLCWHVQSGWNEKLFIRALRAMQVRHAALRSVFVMDAVRRPLQVVMRNAAAPLQTFNLRALSKADQDTEIRQWVAEQKQQGIAIQAAPWRLAIHVLGDTALHLSLVIHHALFDGWSNQHFVAELLANYGKFLHQEFPETRSAPPAYSTLIDLELKSIVHEPSKNFWIEQLQGASMPWWAGAKRARNQRFSYDVPQALNASVEALAQRWHVHEKSIWYTVYAALLAVITGTGKILGSAVTHSRPELENIDQALGVYLNSLPLAVDLEKKSWTEIAQSIHQTLQQQFRHRFYPAAQIQFDTGIDLSASLFNFVQLDQLGQLGQFDLHPGQQNFSESPFGEESTSFPLTFSVHSTVNTHNRKENYSRIDLDVDVDLLPASLEQHLMSYVRQILSLLTAQSARQFSIEDILDESETSQLTTWNATAMAYPESQTLHGLFEAQVASAPGKTALIAGSTSLSYQQLNDRANQRAAVLLSLGVAPEDCVGICLNRTAESLISILAVLKAGACYVPIDPAYPASRVQYLLNDADMHIVITTTELRERLGIDPGKCLCTDQDADVDKHTNQVLSTNLPPVNPGQLAYIIYTSGSTGRPKGVAINHQSGVSLL